MTLPRRHLLAAALPLALPMGTRAQAAGLTVPAAGSVPAAPLLAARFTNLQGQPATLKHQPGRPMVVNFWARWCAPCRVEIPELVALHQREPGLDVLGLNIEADPAPVRDFARAYDIGYPVLLAQDGLALMRALGNPLAGLPFTLWLNRQAQVVALRLGVLSRAQLDAALRLL